MKNPIRQSGGRGVLTRYVECMRDADGKLMPCNRFPLEKLGQAWRAKLRDARCTACGGLWRAGDHGIGCRYHGHPAWR